RGAPGGPAPRGPPEVLATADVVAAEDTRRVRRLAHALGVTIGGRVTSCYDAVEGARAATLTEYLIAGQTVALITDAGMPAVSDPGFRVVAAAAAAGVPVTVVPGPSAVTAALAVSGLPSDRFTFEGFLPRRGGERRGRLRELAAERRTMVFLEAPHRLASSLTDLAAVFGAERAAVACRELTKTWEEIVRGDLGRLVAWATDGREIRGEFTLVVAGAAVASRRLGFADLATATESGVETSAIPPDSILDDLRAPGPPTAAELAAAVAHHEAAGLSRAAARRAVMDQFGVSRAAVYEALVVNRAGDATSRRPPGR
ncbi:16S rRNA (cytidine(1402)-2'-O)-methyltransferase, partial [Frankia sp. AgB1.9]|uniref:16S rRNA (cytidine(1402)-2'-O)-methyltransferase n=1 Tax=Frankia sp. AgB1.9 TaxID=1836968 RepID=UPI001933BF05|nr:16S rRNA (cytidine(1402)-2'-O)-methyltransferase [Frankia sp. AgB1.9]